MKPGNPEQPSQNSGRFSAREGGSERPRPRTRTGRRSGGGDERHGGHAADTAQNALPSVPEHDSPGFEADLIKADCRICASNFIAEGDTTEADRRICRDCLDDPDPENFRAEANYEPRPDPENPLRFECPRCNSVCVPRRETDPDRFNCGQCSGWWAREELVDHGEGGA